MRSVAVVGLGYVGLPLAVELAKKMPVVGYDINTRRIAELMAHYDRTGEVSAEALRSSKVTYTTQVTELSPADFYIITVPTPVNQARQPDLTALILATTTVGKLLKKNDIVVYESTVYPGCTEEVCVPLLEFESGLKFNTDFFCGYSAERISPGDKCRSITKIQKVVSGSNAHSLDIIDSVYSAIITAGTYRASCIQVAEAAKVIENTQRDINIAFVNELSLIFARLGIDTNEVIEAAATKWNFLKFLPGLVGGHCIGVDPYYLAHKAEALGYQPQMILSGRRINEGMGFHVANQVVKLMIKKGINIPKAKVLILGMTFKENCLDVRNSRVIDIINELKDFGCEVHVYDPKAIPEEVDKEYGIKMEEASCLQQFAQYQALVLTVPHEEFKQLNWLNRDRKNQVLFDVKAMLPKDLVDGRL